MDKDAAQNRIESIGMMLLKAGDLLMSNGVSASRTRKIVDRISHSFHYQTDLFITHRSFTITVVDPEQHVTYSRVKRIHSHTVNYKVVSGISRMSWSIEENKLDIDNINKELVRLENLAHYPRLLILSTVGLADAGFCFFAGGHFKAMAVAFFATMLGLFVRQEAHKRKFNVYLCVLLASLSATLLSGAVRYIYPDGGFEPAFATCVLFLIPGVPLINSFTDLFDGNLLNGLLRAVNGLIIAFMIAVGLIISIKIYNF